MVSMFSYRFQLVSFFFFVANVSRISAVRFLAGSPGRLKQVVDRNEEKIRSEVKTCWSSILPLRIPGNRPGLNGFGWVWTCMKRGGVFFGVLKMNSHFWGGNRILRVRAFGKKSSSSHVDMRFFGWFKMLVYVFVQYIVIRFYALFDFPKFYYIFFCWSDGCWWKYQIWQQYFWLSCLGWPNDEQMEQLL